MFWDRLKKALGKEGDPSVEEDIRHLADQGTAAGIIEEDENEWIQNVFEFNDRTAAEIMTREPQIVAIPVTAGRDQIIRTIQDTGFSRYPVYGEDINDILGILNDRDYLLDLTRKRRHSLRSLLRTAYFVPESIRADKLFEDMQKRKEHLAVVVNEYGDTAGVITIEDLLEEIVGNIYDEFDKEEVPQIEKVGDNHWRVLGSTPIRDLAEELGTDLSESEDYDTLGGLILDELGLIPVDGTTPELDADGLHIRVTKVSRHRIEQAIVSLLDPPEEKEEAAEEAARR